jgi:quinol monooxygenase YgiN
LAGLLLQAAEQLEKNPDCLLYAVGLAEEDPNGIWVTEVWGSKEAHAKSLEPEEVRALIQEARPLIAGFGERFETQALGGKGLELRP